jgi:hypothetical protein
MKNLRPAEGMKVVFEGTVYTIRKYVMDDRFGNGYAVYFQEDPNGTPRDWSECSLYAEEVQYELPVCGGEHCLHG